MRRAGQPWLGQPKSGNRGWEPKRSILWFPYEIKTLKIKCHEEIDDRGEADSGPADVWFSYDFATGDSSCECDEYDYED